MSFKHPQQPLYIAEVAYPDSAGRIGVTPCPGRPEIFSGLHRDLEADLRCLTDWGASWMLTLNEDHELAFAGLEHLGERANAHAMQWHHLPIIDQAAPGSRFESAWLSVGPDLHRHLASGGRVAIHCWAGIGRSATVAARLLVEAGMTPRDAVALIRAVRPGAVEAEEQYEHLVRIAGG